MLQVRQVDSSTGILLFLFQAFLIDQGITIIPLRKIFRLTEPFGKTESAIRMGLSRGVKNGLLVNQRLDGEVFYGLSSTTVKSSTEWRTTFARFADRLPRQKQDWDGTWTIAYSPSADPDEAFLSEFGFGLLSRSTWINPFALTKEDLSRLEEVIRGITFFNSQRIAGLTNQQLAELVWAPNRLAPGYRDYLANLQKAFLLLKEATEPEHAEVLFLHRFGLGLFELIQEDPQLPMVLLPKDWCGLEAFREFGKFRAEIHPRVQSWVLRILNDGRDD